jgi:putative hydrolase of the HAD superfamily
MNIIFDLGGVVVRWEPEALLAQIFDDPATCKVLLSEFIGHADWLELDRGTMAPEDAIARAAQRTGLSEPEVRRFLTSVPPALVPIADTVELLYRLRAHGHSLYCLSNMHFASIEYLERTHRFWDVFSGKVISCRVHLCKPEAGIYAHLLETFQLDAAETVFIDDVEVNLAAARQCGIRTIRFESSVQCAGELSALGCM